ncbi:hypothetical protein DDV21_004375 [Streptococcus chenjunshii]|uniref:Uncharacterized protein n=1 Tax=Streptococcus chenjunshii TaxID=2173853 RepID=A0A372KJV2_9STRE|nr:hypothetical protein [Streptococcus chenjunshii]AXQ78365.1 hypothetical protein DDV21_004375 [Streptococcus chenjunshii]RFU50328.1 hypothetical protein DDV22_09330 [Streptococcus chenjunshii]RFU52533.1 hypothetical protein DDV23_09285 [Streptococcus chenjunshii]
MTSIAADFTMFTRILDRVHFTLLGKATPIIALHYNKKIEEKQPLIELFFFNPAIIYFRH